MKQLIKHIPLARKVSIVTISTNTEFTSISGAVRSDSLEIARDKIYNVIGGHLYNVTFIGGDVFAYTVIKGDREAYRTYKKNGGKW